MLSGILSEQLDPDQDRRSVGPDLGSNCLQRFQQTTKSIACKERFKLLNKLMEMSVMKFSRDFND